MGVMMLPHRHVASSARRYNPISWPAAFVGYLASVFRLFVHFMGTAAVCRRIRLSALATCQLFRPIARKVSYRVV